MIKYPKECINDTPFRQKQSCYHEYLFQNERRNIAGILGVKMYHPRFKGNHYVMGQKMGNIFKRCNAQFPIKLDPFQINFGKESGKLLK